MHQPVMTFRDGRTIPQVGLGVALAPADETAEIVRTAISEGYRHIDTAASYDNEEGVGEGVRTSGVPREELFVTTKLWSTSQGYDSTLSAFDESLAKLGLDYVDLYLIHWPSPQRNLYVDSWRAIIRLQEEGRIRSIGVSNFNGDHLDRLIGETGVVPVINQIELHTQFQQRALQNVNAARGILTQAWSPLGHSGSQLKDPVLRDIAHKHDHSAAQVIIRWHVQSGRVLIPKSVRRERMRENIAVFGFTLDENDLAAIAALDDPNGRKGSDPAATNW
jgi:2,5-diketo-D-gluconate reductase A